MRLRRQGVVLGVGAMVCALALSMGAQTSQPAGQTPPANPPTSTPTAPQPSAKQRFPYPGDDANAPAPDAPAANAPAAGDAAKKYPYPESPAEPQPQPSAPAGGYSSSKDSEPAAGPAAGDKPVLSDLGSAGVADPDRAAQDMKVADFYIKDGNYKGAYLRYKDAVAFAPDDAEAHFGLAEMARRHGNKAEAISEYAACLKLEAKGRRAKEARKALEELQPTAAATEAK